MMTHSWTRNRLGMAATLAAALWLAPGTAAAQDEELIVDTPRDQADGGLEEQAKTQVAYVNASGVRLNPIGIFNQGDIVYQRRLYEGASPLTKQNFVGMGLATTLTPIFGRVGAVVDIQPLTVLQLYGRYLFTGYYGSLGMMASFPTADAEYDAGTIDRRAEQPGTENYSTTGHHVSLGSLFRFKVEKVLIRDHFAAHFQSMSLRDGDAVFYDQLFDTMVPNQGWLLWNEFDIGWVASKQVVFGARYAASLPVFRDTDFAGDSVPADAPSNDIHKVGGFFAYMFSTKPRGGYRDPALIALLMWHAKHRYRTGQEVSAAIPQATIAFQFKGDFLHAD